MSWQTFLAIGIGGFIGAVLRAYLNGLISHKFSSATATIPYGTLGVNLLGSFFMGVLFSYFMSSSLSIHFKSFLSTGILGALTTYSTFAIESFLLLNGGHLFLAFSNMALNMFGTILMAGSGYYLTTNFIK
jgi:fluoride exporter